jgi:hypothetical protein
MPQKIILFLKKYQLHIEFIVIALFILWPIFGRGYVLLLDWILTPNLQWNLNWQPNFYLMGLIFPAFSKIFGTIIVEKVFFLIVILLILIGAYKLLQTNNQWVRYFVAFFYLFNPFVYSRFLYGHIEILLAYALLPFVFRYFLNFIRNFNNKDIWKTIFLLTAIGITGIHFLWFVCVGFVIIYLFFILFSLRDPQHIKKNIIGGLKIAFLFLLLNSFWLIPAFLGKSPTAQFINQQIDQRHLNAFRTVSDQNHGVIWNTAAMYGFWGDREGRYAVQKDMVPYWFELYLVILAIVVWGVMSSLWPYVKLKVHKAESRIPNTKYQIQNTNHEPWVVLSFVAIGIISLILAVGIAYPPFEPLILWLNKYIPFYKGYREPQKWVAMLILSYVYLGALGVDDLIPRIQSGIKRLEFKIKNLT